MYAIILKQHQEHCNNLTRVVQLADETGRDVVSADVSALPTNIHRGARHHVMSAKTKLQRDPPL